MRRKCRKIEPAGDGMYRVTFAPAIEISGLTAFEFSLAESLVAREKRTPVKAYPTGIRRT